MLADTTQAEATALQCINCSPLSDASPNRGALKLPHSFAVKVHSVMDQPCGWLHWAHTSLTIPKELANKPAFPRSRPTLTRKPSWVLWLWPWPQDWLGR